MAKDLAPSLEYSSQGLAYKLYRPKQSGSKGGRFPRPPIVLLHGLLGSHKNWESMAKRFQQDGHSVLSFDARNHGSSFHSRDFSYPAMAGDLEQLLRELELQGAVIIGHSLGGRTAMVHALEHHYSPMHCEIQRIAGLIIVDVVPSLENPDTSIGFIVAGMQQVQTKLADCSSRSEVRKILQQALGQQSSKALIEFLLLCNLLPKQTGGYQWSSGIDCIAAQLEQVLQWPALRYNGKTRDIPLLLLKGACSPYVEARGWELLLSYFPDQLDSPTMRVEIPDAYHWPHTEKPEEFYRCCQDFLQSEAFLKFREK